MNLGKRLEKIRKEKEETQQSLGDKAGIKREYLSRIETEELPNPSLKTIRKIADSLGMSLSEFLDGVD